LSTWRQTFPCSCLLLVFLVCCLGADNSEAEPDLVKGALGQRLADYLDSMAGVGYSGAGLGLAIVTQLVASHGGTVQVDSQLVAGSCFSFTLPLA